MLPVAYNLWEFVEFFYYLGELGYDDWFAYDVMSKEIDTVKSLEYLYGMLLGSED